MIKIIIDYFKYLLLLLSYNKITKIDLAKNSFRQFYFFFRYPIHRKSTKKIEK